MRTVASAFTYFDRSFVKGDEVDDDDPVVTLLPDRFEPKVPKESAAKGVTKKERP